MIAMPVNILNQISIRIIREQELIIGPVAWDEAKKVPGLTIVDSKMVKYHWLMTIKKL